MSFGAGEVVPVLFRVEWLEPAAVLFREVVAVLLRVLSVVLADPAVVRLAVVCEVVRAGVLFAAVAPGAAFGAGLFAAFGVVLTAVFGVVLAAAFGAGLSTAFGATLAAAFGVVVSAAFGVVSAVFGAVLTAAFGAALTTGFGAALTAGVFGALSATALCHAFRLGTSAELELCPAHSGAVAATRSSANFR